MTVERRMSDCQTCARPVGDTGYCCWTCTEDLGDELTQLADLADELTTTVTRQSRTLASTGRRSDAASLPFDWLASDSQWTIRNTLTVWVHDIADTRGHAVQTPGTAAGPRCRSGAGCRHASCGLIRWRTPEAPEATLARYLARHDTLRWLRHRPYAGEAFEELTNACRLLRITIDTQPQRAFAGPCQAPTADGTPCPTDLYARPGADYITCRDCSATHEVARRRQWLLDQVRDQLVPASMIATVVTQWSDQTLASATVRSWIRRNRLPAKGYLLDGRPTYNVGDALELMQNSSPREEIPA